MGDGSTKELNVGVLSIQGAFAEHKVMLKRVGELLRDECRLQISEVRKPEHLAGLQGLIIPGGESTTLSVFLGQNNFEKTLREWIFGGKRTNLVWGTCAGLILLSNKLKEQKKDGQVTLGGLDVECSRNRHGRQVSSFESPVALHSDAIVSQGLVKEKSCRGIFIRAPGITKVLSEQVEVLGTLEASGEVVAVQQDNLMATAFHPELTEDLRWHSFFIREIIKALK